ncbi:hypothetical protein FRC04_002941 [Tulasnella sp. 424]|nr:hypothetical protein FRC04_002941 [Tulasnella sp. 424]
MARSLSPNDVVVQVLPHFSEHCNSLKVILSSPEEPALHGDLSSRLKSFKDVMKAPSPKECDANRFYRHLLWTQAQETGLVLSFLAALGHKATLEADASIIFKLLACINPILAAGIKSKVTFSAEIIRASAEAIPKAISACWRKLSNKICPYEAPSVTDLLHLEYLVELGCHASQLIERGRDPKATVRSMEPDTLREL